MSEEELDNILIRQKDRILKWIDRIPTTPKIDRPVLIAKISGAILILGELWSTANYKYKTEELLRKLDDASTRL